MLVGCMIVSEIMTLLIKFPQAVACSEGNDLLKCDTYDCLL